MLPETYLKPISRVCASNIRVKSQQSSPCFSLVLRVKIGILFFKSQLWGAVFRLEMGITMATTPPGLLGYGAPRGGPMVKSCEIYPLLPVAGNGGCWSLENDGGINLQGKFDFRRVPGLVNIHSLRTWKWPFINIHNGFTHEKWWCSIAFCKRLPEGFYANSETLWGFTSFTQPRLWFDWV